jgi:hypothetical protein
MDSDLQEFVDIAFSVGHVNDSRLKFAANFVGFFQMFNPPIARFLLYRDRLVDASHKRSGLTAPSLDLVVSKSQAQRQGLYAVFSVKSGPLPLTLRGSKHGSHTRAML